MIKGDQRDIDMIMNPSRWPGPILCVKRYKKQGSMPQCGTISNGLAIKIAGRPDLGDTGIIAEYDTVQAMVDDGWMVD